MAHSSKYEGPGQRKIVEDRATTEQPPAPPPGFEIAWVGVVRLVAAKIGETNAEENLVPFLAELRADPARKRDAGRVVAVLKVFTSEDRLFDKEMFRPEFTIKDRKNREYKIYALKPTNQIRFYGFTDTRGGFRYFVVTQVWFKRRQKIGTKQEHTIKDRAKRILDEWNKNND
jgi:hypothetical protein